MINHNFKKKFGQNFLNDKNLLKAIVNDAKLNAKDEVLEIGAGAGALTEVISQTAKKVVSYEIDKDLEKHLLSLSLENVTFKFNDIMELPLEEIEKDFDGNYKIIANLPYYITSPIIFKFLNNSSKIESLTIMVQKEVAQRIVAPIGTKDYGILSIMINFYGDAFISRHVNRKMFTPIPNVDSAVVVITANKKYKDIDGEKFFRFVQQCFSMRRKTLKNNLKCYGDKLNNLSQEMLSLRAEMLSLDQLIDIYRNIF